MKFVERFAENTLLLGKRPGEAFLANLHGMAIHSKNLFNDSVKALFNKDYQLAENVVSKPKAIVPLENELIRTISRRMEPGVTSNLR